MLCSFQAWEFLSFTLAFRDHKELKNIVDSSWIPFLHVAAAGRCGVLLTATVPWSRCKGSHRQSTRICQPKWIQHSSKCAAGSPEQRPPLGLRAAREQSSSAGTSALVVQRVQHACLSRPVLRDCCALPQLALSCVASNGLSPHGSFSTAHRLLSWW